MAPSRRAPFPPGCALGRYLWAALHPGCSRRLCHRECRARCLQASPAQNSHLQGTGCRSAATGASAAALIALGAHFSAAAAFRIRILRAREPDRRARHHAASQNPQQLRFPFHFLCPCDVTMRIRAVHLSPLESIAHFHGTDHSLFRHSRRRLLHHHRHSQRHARCRIHRPPPEQRRGRPAATRTRRSPTSLDSGMAQDRHRRPLHGHVHQPQLRPELRDRREGAASGSRPSATSRPAKKLPTTTASTTAADDEAICNCGARTAAAPCTPRRK